MTVSDITELLNEHAGSILSKREVQCLEMLCKGLTAKAIACNLGLSQRTVENYIANIKSKFKVSTKSELLNIIYNLK